MPIPITPARMLPEARREAQRAKGAEEARRAEESPTQQVHAAQCFLNNPLIFVLLGMPTKVNKISGVVGGAKLNNSVRPSPLLLVPADCEDLRVD